MRKILPHKSESSANQNFISDVVISLDILDERSGFSDLTSG